MIRLLIFLNIFLLTGFGAYAQVDTTTNEAPIKIAIVAPLFLDEAFENGAIKESLPRNMNAGLDFIHGAEIALENLNVSPAAGRQVEAYIIDSKRPGRDLKWMMTQGGLDEMDLIIGGVRDVEFQQLADFARLHRIPFVSAVYPNAGGVRRDSFLIIVNSTLQTNIEGIYSYIVQKHSTDQILMIRQRNDNRIDEMFSALNRAGGKNLLKIQSIAVDSINSSQLAMLIDTLKPSIVIGATLNEWMALNIADACSPYKDKLRLIGMPNWDGFRELFNKDRYKDFPILFPTPHLDEQKNEFSDYLANRYFTLYRARPGETVSRGFEVTHYFANVLLHFGEAFMEHLNENQFACFHEFNFQPVSVSGTGDVDYFENKHIFIAQILNGLISRYGGKL